MYICFRAEKQKLWYNDVFQANTVSSSSSLVLSEVFCLVHVSELFRDFDVFFVINTNAKVFVERSNVRN